jgi:predicted AAA+ superfamily ATPase
MLTISENEIIARLKFDNPWWEDRNTAIPHSKHPKRKYFFSFYENILDRSVNRALVLMGPRRVGKTVMVMQSIYELIHKNSVDHKKILFLSLETPIYTGIALEKLLNIFNSLHDHKRHDELYIYFDEIQYLRDWEVHLKSLVDSYPDYKFVVTGSAAAALRLKSNESGAGRFSDYVLPPLTFAEYLSFIGKESDLINYIEDEEDDENENDEHEYTTNNIEDLNKEFVNYLNYGGYPETVFSKTIRENQSQYIKSDIIDKVLLRDLPSLYGINDIQELNRLFTTLAYNTGQEVSLDGLSKDSGVAKNTIKRYLEYLEAAFLIKRVERIDNNCKRFKRANFFKIYLTNPSMRAALFGQIEPDSPHMGALTETAIYSQWQHGAIDSLYYARWDNGEIDIVYLGSLQKPLWFIEIKWTDRPFTDHKELDNCISFKRKNPSLQTNSILVTSKTIDDELVYRDELFTFKPSSLYAYIVGFNSLKRIGK